MKKFTNAVFKEYGMPIKSDADLKDIDFKNKSRVHEWKNYVQDFYVKNWQDLTYRERVIIYCEAEYQADKEEWD